MWLLWALSQTVVFTITFTSIDHRDACIFVSLVPVFVFTYYGIWWLFKILHLFMIFNTVLRHSERLFCPPAVQFIHRLAMPWNVLLYSLRIKQCEMNPFYSHLNDLNPVNGNRSGHYVVCGNFSLLKLIIATSSMQHPCYFLLTSIYLKVFHFQCKELQNGNNISTNGINPFYQCIKMCTSHAQRAAIKW